MSNSEQQLETEDMYDDELDCVYEEEENGTEEEDDEEGNEEMEVKEEKVEADNEIAVYRAVSESQSTEPKTKTEEQDETSIDMYDDEFHLIMENDFAATAENVNEVSEALSVNEESETDSDATEIDDENYEAVSEPQQTEAVVNESSSSSSEEQQLNRRQRKTKNHRCQKCNKSFNDSSNFKRHQRVHTGVRPHKCTVCSKAFALISSLKIHQRVHTGVRPYKCTVCSKSFTQLGNLQTHQMVHTGVRPHKCTVCFNSFTQLSNLKTHQKVHSNSRPFQCTICQQTFKRKHDLQRHLRAKHPQKMSDTDGDMYDEFDCGNNDEENGEEENKGIVVKEEEDSEIENVVLESVDQPVGNESKIKTEEPVETSIDMFEDAFYFIMKNEFAATAENVNEVNEALSENEDSETDSDATETDDEDYEAVSEPQSTEAVVNESSSSASEEQQTNLRPRTVKKHKCQQCNKSFDRPSKLKVHQSVHTGVRPYKCTICSKTFTQLGNLQTHQLTHTGVQSHKCTICSKSFKIKRDLKRHRQVHTGVRPHKCTTCSKSFTQLSHLKTHQHTVHSNSRPFQCTICQQTFKHRHLQRKMSDTEQLFGTDGDMYDEFDCDNNDEENGEEKNEGIVVKEEEDSEIENDVLESVDQPVGNEPVETSIDMYSDEFRWFMEKNFAVSAENVNEVSEALSENEDSETDTDATETDDEDYEAVSEPQQTETVVIVSSSSLSEEQQTNHRQRTAKSHKCQQCNKNFDRPSHLKRHQVVHTEPQQTETVVNGNLSSASGEQQPNRRQKETKKHKCQQCNKSFDYPFHLNRHQLVHTGVRAHKCTVCSKSFTLFFQLKTHQLVHTGVRAHKCATCFKSFKTNGDLKTHQIVHSNSRPFHCTMCQQTFKHKSSLKSHHQAKHPQKMSDTEQLFGTDGDMYDEFDCENNDEENGEEKNEGIVVKEEEDSEIDYGVLKNVDQPTGNESKIKTEQQDETSIDMFEDAFHFIMENEFAATAENVNEVNEELSENEESETDSDATETDDEDYEAVSAETAVNDNSSSLSEEQQTNHRQRTAKSHKCQQCNKSFDRPFELKRHKLVHTGVRPHKCTICSKSFTQLGNLQTHQLIHTGVRPHKCTVCSKSFKLMSHLQRHQLVHTDIQPHKCTVCSKSFKRKDELQQHQLVHTDIRAHKCKFTATLDHFIAPFVSKPSNTNILSNAIFMINIHTLPLRITVPLKDWEIFRLWAEFGGKIKQSLSEHFLIGPPSRSAISSVGDIARKSINHRNHLQWTVLHHYRSIIKPVELFADHHMLSDLKNRPQSLEFVASFPLPVNSAHLAEEAAQGKTGHIVEAEMVEKILKKVKVVVGEGNVFKSGHSQKEVIS
ncbi:hypothetical protein TYRP_015383 [Tyrophagus putrescentiae]|nr:hypothetical protein TYRP_015383 [Tyrophagus putrescentiae]